MRKKDKDKDKDKDTYTIPADMYVIPYASLINHISLETLSLDLLNVTLGMAELDGDKKMVAFYHTKIAEELFALGKFETSLVQYRLALKIYKELGDKKEEANTLRSIGDIFLRALKKPKKSLEQYRLALKIYKELGDKKEEANTLCKIGAILFALGKPRKSLKQYRSALKIYKELGDKKEEAKYSMQNW